MTPTKVIGDYGAAVAIDGSTHYLLIQPGSSATAYKKINRNVFLGVTGQPVDINSIQTVSNKILDNTNTITVRDGVFTLQDDVDLTKQARFQLSGITTATTRTYTLPNASSTLADISTVQTFTNKTLTSPTISGGSIDNSTVTVDTISGHTTPNSGTVYGVAISAGTIGTNGIASGAITSAKVATGFCVQEVNTPASTGANTGTTIIPFDDTIPQITEGTEFMTQTITPKATSNILVISVQAMVTASVASQMMIGALFQDATPNALAASSYYIAAVGTPTILTLVYTMVAGTTSSTTFRFRAGSQSAATTTFNGAGGVRLFGATNKSSITITEYKV